MDKKRILLMYISENSGHHQASLAIERAFYEISDDVETLNVNSFNYTNPILEKIISKTYASIIKRRPEVWGYLYDNPKIVMRTKRLRESIHRYDSLKMRELITGFRPHAVVCTQAFPCGIMGDYKKRRGNEFFLAGVLTDYAPHSYWPNSNIDMYFVPSEKTRERLVANGVSKETISLTGIPVDHRFRKIIQKEKVFAKLGLHAQKNVILVMGGSQGLGPIKEIVRSLDSAEADFQMIVISGTNARLAKYLSKKAKVSRKKIVSLGFVKNIDEIMSISTLIITKPGGITISEALAKSLPIVIIRPIPGQEAMNTEHLLSERVAVKMDNLNHAGAFIGELLNNPALIGGMRERASQLAKPESALNVAKALLGRIM
ncbi:MAG: UDP-N-acetylglucosamine 2-epimerase [Candidatus Omnitrophica bacterium]|nr:UDP-N-acetylglucosamine 2-epimerase [Candidatus Omnitrophota bacterium]